MSFRLRHYVHIDDRVIEKFFNVNSLFKMTQDYSNWLVDRKYWVSIASHWWAVLCYCGFLEFLSLIKKWRGAHFLLIFEVEKIKDKHGPAWLGFMRNPGLCECLLSQRNVSTCHDYLTSHRKPFCEVLWKNLVWAKASSKGSFRLFMWFLEKSLLPWRHIHWGMKVLRNEFWKTFREIQIIINWW